ncbi:hypothetical protein Vi05172_g13285 [Venturia inaequalis]|nr:hypothetical protein Vi05172_g13285 [Venturia inaequalis]
MATTTSSHLSMATATSAATGTHTMSSILSSPTGLSSATGPALLNSTTSPVSAAAINSTTRSLLSNNTSAATAIATRIPHSLMNGTTPAINATAQNHTMTNILSITSSTTNCDYTYRTPVDTWLANNGTTTGFRYTCMVLTTILQILGVLASAMLLLLLCVMCIARCIQGIRRIRKWRENKRKINGIKPLSEGREIDNVSPSSSAYSSESSITLVDSNEQRAAAVSSDNREMGEAATYDLGTLRSRAFDPNEEYGLHQAVVRPANIATRGQGAPQGRFSRGNASYRYSPQGQQTSQSQTPPGQPSHEQPASAPSSRAQASWEYPTSGHRYASDIQASRVPEGDRLPHNPSVAMYQRMGGNPWV